MSLFSRRPRFQLSLRSLFVLFLLACVLIGGGIKWRQRALLQQQVVRQLVGPVLHSRQSFGGSVVNSVQCTYDFQQTEDLVQQRLFSPKPSWLSSIFGVDMIHSIREIRFSRLANQADFELIGRLGYVTHLELMDGVEEFGDWENLCLLSKLTHLTVYLPFPLGVLGQRLDPRTGNRFEHLHNLSRLSDLQLIEPELHEAEWISILEHPSLEILKLSDFEVPLPTVSLADPAATKLRKLYLSNFETPQETILTILDEVPNLEFLSIAPMPKTEISDEIFNSISKLRSLEKLFLHATKIKGHELHKLQNLPIKEMSLGFSNLDDLGLENLAEFKHLDYLEVGSTKISDRGMKSLAQLSGLRYLSIRDTRITNKGFLELAKIKELKTIRIRDTLISDEGVQQFRRLLPECAIDVR